MGMCCENRKRRMGREREEAYPPYVLPCSPGWMQSMMSLSANTADTGYTTMQSLIQSSSGITRTCGNTHCHRTKPCLGERHLDGRYPIHSRASSPSDRDPVPNVRMAERKRTGRRRTVWISSQISNTLCFLQSAWTSVRYPSGGTTMLLRAKSQSLIY